MVNCFKRFLASVFICIISVNVTATPLIKTPIKLKPIKSGDPLPADIFIKMAKIINPTVVNISTTQLTRTIKLPQFNDPFFDFFFALPLPTNKMPLLKSLGTGFIVQSDGLILTNTHVINKADTIQVQLKNNKFYIAQIIGQDAYTDIALIKIKVPNKKLPVASLGNSHQLQVGEWVAAFGNPYGHGHTMTKGIISAINRNIDELNLFPFLQTDAIINPGNSGGPLVNTQGEVIGINTAMRTQGISFAIPIDNVKVILKELTKYGHVRRGFIGVQMAQYPNTQIKKGALILNVINNTPAKKAGIKKNDVIVSFNKRKIINYKDLFKAVAATPVNKTVPIVLIRSKKQISLNIKVAERIKKQPSKNITASVKNNKSTLFNLGLTLTNSTKKIMQSMNLPILNQFRPIVLKVTKKSVANFSGVKSKDIILKVNGQHVFTVQEIQKRLSKYNNTLNILRYRPHSRQYLSIIIPLKRY